MDIKNINTYEPNFKSLKIVRKRGAKFVHSLNMEELKVFKKCAEMLKDTKHVDVYVGAIDLPRDACLVSIKNRLDCFVSSNRDYTCYTKNDGTIRAGMRLDKYKKKDVDEWWKPQSTGYEVDSYKNITKKELKDLRLKDEGLETEELVFTTIAALAIDEKIDKEIAEFKEKVGDSPERTELIKSLLRTYGDEKIDSDKDYTFYFSLNPLIIISQLWLINIKFAV